jgi:type I restriction enzyme M protein
LSGERYKEKIISRSKFELVKVDDGIDKVVYTNKILKSDFLAEGKFPIIDQSENFIAGYWDNEEDVFRIKKPITIFGDHTRCVKFIDFDFVLGADGVKILEPIIKFEPKFFYYLIRSIEVKSLGYSRHYKELKDIEIPLPPLEIQKEIVTQIEGWQKIIDGARQIVENYKPQIDIDPEWPMVELENYIDFVSGLTLSIPDCEDKDGVPIIAINNVTEEGELTLEGLRTIKLPKQKTINFLRKGDLLFNWRNGSKRLVGKTALFDLEGEYVFASFLLGIRPKENFLLHKYLWYLLNNYRRDGKYEQFMRQNINGLFNREELKILKIPLPSIKKQESIVNRIHSEQKLVESNKEIITMFEQKIKDKIAKVLGE